jgi:HPr kinase/phosphorylase
MPNEIEQQIHATTVALGAAAAVIRGPSGAGKSDLALRFLAFRGGWPGASAEHTLVADDQTILRREKNHLIASAPQSIAGRLEVRGIGIVEVPHRANALVRLVVDLVVPSEVQRYPLTVETVSWFDVTVPLVRLAPFEASAPLKLMLMLHQSN